MRILYLDCQAGIAGDMTVAALLELGVPLAYLETELAKLALPANSFRLSTEQVRRGGIAGTRFIVEAAEEQSHRHYGEICQLLAESAISPLARAMAESIFARLAAAEAKVHGVTVDEVHFHEVGAIDAIVDIVGVAICLDWLAVDAIFAAPLPLGRGWVDSAHGRLPVPAPATMELLQGLAVHMQIGPGERVTPTGAAIVAALASREPLPVFVPQGVGNGAGSSDFADTANILRAVLGEQQVTADRDEVVVLETHLDDLSPEVLGFVMEQLLAAGALDVAYGQLQMKKNRPGVRVTVIALPEQAEALARMLLTETTALGVRMQPMQRLVLARAEELRETSFGPVQVKVAKDGAKILRVTPEYAECRRLALERKQPLMEIFKELERELQP